MGPKKYFQKQFRTSKFLLEHDDVNDFYISCWQRNLSVLPLLCIRAVVFAGCLAILIASMILTTMELEMNFSFWFIYMTHWGLILVTLTSGCAFLVSCVAYNKGELEHIFKLPWYVQVYWALFNSTIAIAFFITVFYYALLSSSGEEFDFAINPVLDFFIHGMNSILMVVLLMTSRHPVNILHFYFPVIFGLIYLAFNLIYYFAGGLDPRGNHYIYPNIDWEKPGETAVMCVISAIVIIVVHFLVVGLTLLRNYFTRNFKNDSMTLN